MIKLNPVNVGAHSDSSNIEAEMDQFKTQIREKTSSISFKIVSFLGSIFNEVSYGMRAGFKNMFTCMFPSEHATLKTSESTKTSLIVFFHGLNGRPSVWNTHISEFKKLAKNNNEFSPELFAPCVPKKGHCSLDDPEVKALFDEIKKWSESNPGKPITLFGQSNGSRLALALEAYLRSESPATPVMISSTGGALYGSSVVTKLMDYFSPEFLEKVSCGLITKIACEQLSYGSDSSKELLNNSREPLAEGVAPRKYQWIGAFYDTHLRETSSSLPVLNPAEEEGKIEKHYLVANCGHNSVVNACTEKQLKTVFNWTSKLTGAKVRLSASRIALVKSPDENCVKVRDNRFLLENIGNIATAVFNHLTVLAIKAKRRTLHWLAGVQSPSPSKDPATGDYSYPKEQLPWHNAKQSKGLFLTIHGLRGSTTEWEKYEADFKQNYPDSHHFNPQVALRGNCALEIAAKPLLDTVKSYLEKFPGAPVTIIGTSNGGRIATYIESHLDPELLGNSKLAVVSIAGVHYGTKVVTLANSLGLLSLAGLDSTLGEEFQWGSDAAKANLATWRNKQATWQEKGKNVQHLFIAATEDEQVRSLSASLPQAPENTTPVEHLVYSGQTHITLVDASHEKVMKWIKKKRG